MTAARQPRESAQPARTALEAAHGRAVTQHHPLLALQRTAGNAAVNALLAARMRGPAEQAAADIDGALTQLQHDDPALEPVEKGLRAAQSLGVPVELEGPKPPPAALAVTTTGFGPHSVAPKAPTRPPKPTPAVHPLGAAAARGAGAGQAPPGGAPANLTAGGAVAPALTAPPLPAEQIGQPPAPPTPVTPGNDPAFRRVTGGVTRVAKAKRAHAPAHAKAKQAQDAAQAPADDLAAQARAAKVDTMDAQRPGSFDKQAFIAAVKTAIEQKSPRTLQEADNYAGSGRAGEVQSAVRGMVGQGRAEESHDIAAATDAAPDPSRAVAKPVTPMRPEQPGPAGAVPAGGAAPKPAPAEQLNLTAGPQQVNDEMAAGGVTEQQLAESNEPQFQQALADRQAAAQHSATAPAQYRSQEQGVITQTAAQANAQTAEGVQAMHASRTGGLGALLGQQAGARSRDEAKRAEVTSHVQSIFTTTEADVKRILDGIDPKVDAAFEQGEAAARSAFEKFVSTKMAAYKEDRYSGWLGGLRWAKDKLLGMPEKVNEFYAAGRELYLKQMDGVISRVADIVGGDLNAAKARIAAGKAQIGTYVKSLPADLRRIGSEASTEIGERFSQLEGEVDEKQQAVVDGLASRYVEARQGLDDRITELQAENRGLVDRAIDGIKAVVNTIRELVAMLGTVLARVAGVVGDIIKKPVEFLGNLVDGVKGGILRFKDNIADHLRRGLMGWLFGTLASAGVELPETFDLKGVVHLLASIFGLTWTNIRNRIVRQIGERAMSAAERGVHIFQVIASEGIGGLWQMLVEKLGDIKDVIVEQAKEFVITRIITAGITWLIGLLNPAAAFIKACKLIYDIIMFFVNNGSRIMDFVNTVIDSTAEVVRGNVGAVVNKIEDVLGRMVPLVIGFLASAIGLGGIGERVRAIIDTLRRPVNRAVDGIVRTGLRLAGPIIRGISGLGARARTRIAAGRNRLTAALRGGDDSPAGRQQRLERAMRAGVAVADRFSGRPVGARVLGPALGAIRLRYGLPVLEAVPQGGNWAIHGEVQRAVATTSAVVPAGTAAAAPGTAHAGTTAVVDPNDPGTPAPGIGRIGSHGTKPSSQRNGPRIHWMESEHVIPFAVGKRLWQMVDLAMPGRGGHEDRNQTTVMIYKGAADAKTGGDEALWNGFEAAVGRADIQRRLSAVRTALAAGVSSARDEGAELIGLLMQGMRAARDDAVARTNRAVQDESRSRTEGYAKTNAERRGAPGSPEPATPDDSRIQQAADQQYDNVTGLLNDVLDEVNAGRRPTITPRRRRS